MMPWFIVKTARPDAIMTVVGRNDELKSLSLSLDSTIEGEGQTIFVSGAAGVGKSALLEDFATIARSKGFNVLNAGCIFESLAPYLPMREALRSGGLDFLMSDETPPRLIASYLIHGAGGILVAKSERREGNLDAEIFSSMLTAVADFVRDSLRELDSKISGRAPALNRMGYERYNIIIERGKYLNLAAIIEGKENEFILRDMKGVLETVEKRHGTIFEKWNGEVDTVSDSADTLQELFQSGRYDGAEPIAVDPASRRSILFEGVALGVARASEKKPILLILDDLHWADPSSLALLHYISRNTRSSRVLIACSYRPEDLLAPQSRHPLLETIRKMRAEGLFVELNLQPLDRSGTTGLITLLLGMGEPGEELSNRIFCETEGNPLFIREVVAYLRNQGALTLAGGAWKFPDKGSPFRIPPLINDIISGRLSHLEPTERETLDAASVLGQSFGSDILALVMQRDRLQVLRQLNSLAQSHQLIVSGDRAYSFSHVKVRDVVYDALSPELRREYHLRTAEEMQKLDTSEGLAIRSSSIALHYYHAESPHAVSICISCARTAKDNYQNEEALRFYSMALETMSKASSTPLDYPLVLEETGDANIRAGRFKDAIDCFSRVLIPTYEIQTMKSDPRCLARLHRKMSIAYVSLGDNATALLEAEQGLSSSQRGDIEQWRCLAQKARVLMWSGQHKDSISCAEEALKGLAAIPCTEGDLSDVYTTIGACSDELGNYDRAIECYSKSLETCERLGDPRGIGAAYNNLGLIHHNLGKMEKALDHFEKSGRICVRAGDQRGTAVAYNNIGLVLRDRDDTDGAVGYFSKALWVFEKIGDQRGIAGSCCNLGDVTRDASRIQEAKVWYMRGISTSRSAGTTDFLAENLLGLAELESSTGDTDTAMALCREAATIAYGSGGVLLRAQSNRVEGMVMGVRGQWVEAEGMLRSAEKELTSLGSEVELAKVWFEQGAILISKGETQAGFTRIVQASDVFTRRGMRTWEKRCRDWEKKVSRNDGNRDAISNGPRIMRTRDGDTG